MIKLSKYEVKLKEQLGWYAREEIKNEMISGARMDNSGLKGFEGSAMLKSKMKLWELSIEEIKEGEKVIPFSIDWAKALSYEDGNLLDKEIEKLDNSSKKV
jgi:hypothetical protein